MIKFYNLWELYDHDLFDDIKLPTGIDKEILVNTIFSKCATYSPLYHEHDLLVNMINNWFMTWYDSFDRIAKAMQEDYNPLHNYDRFEDIDRNFNHKGSVDKTYTGNETEDETNISNDTSTGQVSAFDSSAWQNADKNTDDLTANRDLTKTRNLSDEETRNLTDTQRETAHIYGNIGVTTSQQMLESEIDLRERYNIYNYIAQKFYDDFMLKIEL